MCSAVLCRMLKGKDTIVMSEKERLTRMEDFERVIAPVIEWYKKNCDPHQMIIIEAGVARLTSDEIGIPFETVD